jgi:hypothetical protein
MVWLEALNGGGQAALLFHTDLLPQTFSNLYASAMREKLFPETI